MELADAASDLEPFSPLPFLSFPLQEAPGAQAALGDSWEGASALC